VRTLFSSPRGNSAQRRKSFPAGKMGGGKGGGGGGEGGCRCSSPASLKSKGGPRRLTLRSETRKKEREREEKRRKEGRLLPLEQLAHFCPIQIFSYDTKSPAKKRGGRERKGRKKGEGRCHASSVAGIGEVYATRSCSKKGHLRTY